MNGKLGMKNIAARCEMVGRNVHIACGGRWECVCENLKPQHLDLLLLGVICFLLRAGGGETHVPVGGKVADGNSRCGGGWG